MATAFNLVDYRTIERVRRPRLRIVEPTVAKPALEPVEKTEAPKVAEPAEVHECKPMPPAWMIASPFREERAFKVSEPQAVYRPAVVVSTEGPYRSVREVPRVAW